MLKKCCLFGGLALLLTACGSGNTDVMYECPSPSGQKVATFYRVSTGDRPGDQTMKLNIRPVGKTFDADMYSFSFRHGYDAIVRWTSESAMQIEYPRGSEITTQEQTVFGSSQTFNSADTIRMDYVERVSSHGHFLVEQRCFKEMDP